MQLLSHMYLRLIPAIYFMLLGIFFIVTEWSHSGFSSYSFSLYAALLLPVLIPVKFVWILFGIITSLVFGLFLLNGLIWFVQYVNGVYFRYPFDTFTVGFPFIIWTLFCAMWIGYTGLVAKDNVLYTLRLRKAGRR